ncbi:MAG: YHYH protein [Pseudomonadota bacterium]
MGQRTALLATLALTALSLTGYATYAAVTVNDTGDSRCIASNGLPDHPTGTFPNRGNPHEIRAQNINVCIPSDPVKGDFAQKVETIGIATNGVIIRPGTADYYDASSPRGHSRDPSSGWNLEAIGAGNLGLDGQNAHVDHRGLYHYHGMPPALDDVAVGTLSGWAADGFEIHYAGETARSSYALKAGTRPTAPGGAYDGTYVEDWEYVEALGNLDECNGATVNGEYVYFATDTFPFFPRCLWGTEIAQIR